MSHDSCIVCGDLVDTDEHPEAYRPPYDNCICDNCDVDPEDLDVEPDVDEYQENQDFAQDGDFENESAADIL